MGRPFKTKTTEELRTLLLYFDKTKDSEGIQWVKDEALYRLMEKLND